MSRDIGAVLPELCLLLGAGLALFSGLVLPRHRQAVAHLVATGALVVATALALLAWTRPDMQAFHGTYAVDPTTHAARVIVAPATVGVLAISRPVVRGTHRETEYATLLVLAALGAILLAGTTDLLVLVAAYLLGTIPLYALAGFGKTAAETESALKLVLFGALSGITMLAGITVLFGLGGATAYQSLGTGLAAAPAPAVAAGSVGVLAGLLFKAGAAPAHFWVPDAAEGTGIGVAAFLTTVPKIGALAAIHRVVGDAIPAAAEPALIVASLAALAMTLGNFAAFWQDSARRLLAYSTISQVGYLLIAIAAVGSELSQPSLLFYLAAYAVTNLGAFAVVAAHGDRLADYAGLFRRAPVLALTLVVCLLGLVGTPPTAVFVGKLGVFSAGVDAGLAWLVVLAILNTVASLFYYLRWVAPMFTQPSRGRTAAEGWASATAYACGAGTVVLGLTSGVLL